MSLEMAHKVILPPKKNYIPQFLKQRDINSYNVPVVYMARDIMILLRANPFRYLSVSQMTKDCYDTSIH
jgi:hypothetical protein